MSAIDMADLRRRVEENVAALCAGEVLPHQFTEEESLALRPRHTPTFGIRPDGRIVHCGTALWDKTELDIDLWNDSMRIEAGFPPENSSEEFRAKVRADLPRRLAIGEAREKEMSRLGDGGFSRRLERNRKAWARDIAMSKRLGRFYFLYRFRFLIGLGALGLLTFLLQH
jgi:hypothetical protein